MFTQLPFRALLIVGALALLGWAPLSTAVAMDWEIESFDRLVLWFGDGVSIAVDQDGNPYIAHDVSLEGMIHFAFRGPEGWVIEAVDDYYSSGGGSAVALDASGTPCIVYGDGNPDIEPVVLTFARRTPSGWEREAVDQMRYDSHVALRFRSDGLAVIAYSAEGGGQLKYASQTAGGSWDVEIADAVPASGCDMSLVLDENDDPHLCHWESTSGRPRQVYTCRKDGLWLRHILDAVGMCNAMGSGIDVDGQGNVHIAWQIHECESPGALYYAKLSEAGSSTAKVDSDFSFYSAGCSLVVDRLGRPHILYGTQGQLVGGPSELRYAHLDEEGKWVHELVDDDGDCGEINAVTIDADGFLHVAYYAGDGSTQFGVIRYARSATPVAPPPLPGDLDCDGMVNAFDIDPFVLALTDEAAYAAEFPTCDYMAADTNQDGEVNVFDVDPFVALLTGS